tara:strand:+ start:577 stop:882 length:306 start_codon:yes stop_codon:yes gene_type:complete
MNANERNRLDRIEEKIDKLADAVVSIARAEEKIHSLEDKVVTVWQSLDDAHTKLDEIDDRLHAAEESVNISKSTISNIVRLGWIVVAAVITAGIGMITMIN